MLMHRTRYGFLFGFLLTVDGVSLHRNDVYRSRFGTTVRVESSVSFNQRSKHLQKSSTLCLQPFRCPSLSLCKCVNILSCVRLHVHASHRLGLLTRLRVTIPSSLKTFRQAHRLRPSCLLMRAFSLL